MCSSDLGTGEKGGQAMITDIDAKLLEKLQVFVAGVRVGLDGDLDALSA